jgi:hypothetical protein
MKRLAAVILCASAAFAGTLPAGAQAPHPSTTPHARKTPVSSLSNPAGRSNTHTMSGQGCISGPNANRALQTINPVTGKPYGDTIVEVPLTKGGGSVANATTRAQQAQACAHRR